MYASVFFYLSHIGFNGRTSNVPSPTFLHLKEALVATVMVPLEVPLFHQASVVEIDLAGWPIYCCMPQNDEMEKMTELMLNS